MSVNHYDDKPEFYIGGDWIFTHLFLQNHFKKIVFPTGEAIKGDEMNLGDLSVIARNSIEWREGRIPAEMKIYSRRTLNSF